MIQCVSIPAILIIVGLPFWIEPTWVVGLIAIVAGIFCTASLIWRSVAAICIGGVTASIDLALSLSWSSSSLSWFGAAAFGLALLLLLDTTSFAGRFHQADIDPSALRLQISWWIARAAVAAGGAVVIVATASVLTFALPAFGRPILAGVGAVIALVAAMLLARSSSEERERST
jgi:hypothetical protein